MGAVARPTLGTRITTWWAPNKSRLEGWLSSSRPYGGLSMAEWLLGSFYDPSMFWEGVDPIWLVHERVTFGVAGAVLAS